jgi:hypothetical protein
MGPEEKVRTHRCKLIQELPWLLKMVKKAAAKDCVELPKAA